MFDKTLYTILSVLLLLAMPVMAADSIFANALYEKPAVEKRLETVIVAGGNALCAQGMIAYCQTETVEVEEVVGTPVLYYPFQGHETAYLYSGSQYDSDDVYTETYYNTTNLKVCAANASTITDIYTCVQEFNREQPGSCLTSTSAFKIAYLNSPLYGQPHSYELSKVFVSGPNYNAHRYVVLKNENGYYVLDPLWCRGNNTDFCITTHTKMFYDNEKAINYRGIVFKVDRFA